MSRNDDEPDEEDEQKSIVQFPWPNISPLLRGILVMVGVIIIVGLVFLVWRWYSVPPLASLDVLPLVPSKILPVGWCPPNKLDGLSDERWQELCEKAYMRAAESNLPGSLFIARRGLADTQDEW